MLGDIPKNTKDGGKAGWGRAEAMPEPYEATEQPWDAQSHAAAPRMPGMQDCTHARQSPLPAQLLHYLHT